MSPRRYATQYCASEWSFVSGRAYSDPFNQVDLDVLFSDPQGQEWRVPAYWSGEQEWRVRFAPPGVGCYTYRSICSDAANPDLHDQRGELDSGPYGGSNPLLMHGPLQVRRDRRHLQYADGTPFLWLGDTWWMALCRRLQWPDEFQLLAADRVAKGFSVIQIVAGLYPDMPAYDERGFNEAGHPWAPEYARLNPAYFDMADLRLRWLVHVGLMPCIVGCWGYHLPWLGQEKMTKHWRNLIARYGAYPVVWCLAGEGAMPYYLAEDKARAREMQIQGWTRIARYVRQTDPYHRLITVHPTDSARNQVTDDLLIDLDMLQTGHGGYESIPNTVDKVRAAVARTPHMPVIEGEANYEGIMEGSRQEMQRFIFWSCFLSGAAGFTYGANGLWQLNREEQPYGPSPHGTSWGDIPWTEAYRLPGSTQIGLGKRLLERYEWWRFEPHQEWVSPSAKGKDYYGAYAAGIPGRVRVIYFPKPILPWTGEPAAVHGLEPGVGYKAYFFDPKSAKEYPLGHVVGVEKGDWSVPQPPLMQDWVLVLESPSV